MLYGIALADGKVPPPEARLYDQFPEYRRPREPAGPGAHHGRPRAQHDRWASNGTSSPIPYGDPRNSEIAMEAAPDRYRYILSLPIVGEPGVKWTYCGGCHGAARPADRQGHRGEAARTMRAACCSIRSGLGPSNGRPTAAASRAPRRAGACARPISCASARWCWRTAPGRAGRSCRRSGSSDRRRPPSPSRARAATAGTGISASCPSARRVRSNRTISAIGWGGQRLFLVPALDLAVAMNAGNYRRPIWNSGRIAAALITDLVLPGARPEAAPASSAA